MSTNKETKEAIVGVLELALAMIGVLKDGAQLNDVSALFYKFQNDANFKTKLEQAVIGANLIPSELKDLDLKEGLDIATEVLALVPRFVDVFIKKT